MTESLEELRKRLDLEYEKRNSGYFSHAIRQDWPRISRALGEMRDWMKYVVENGRSDARFVQQTSDLLARLGKGEP